MLMIFRQIDLAHEMSCWTQWFDINISKCNYNTKFNVQC